jgi:hypothetical protein
MVTTGSVVHHYKALFLKTEKFWNSRRKMQEAAKNPVAKKPSDAGPGMAPGPSGCDETIKPT